MEFLLTFAASPFIISALTGWIKGWTPFANLSDTARPAIIRVLAAVISFGYVLFGFWITGNVDSNVLGVSLQALILAVVPWLGSLGVFHAFFQKK
jgi:hypothetical protein